MILFSQVSLAYTDRKILNNFNYCFADTGLYAVKGASGCGKTTLLNLIGGLLKPTEGKILYSENIRCIRTSSVYIFQDNNLLDGLTVYKNVKLFTEIVRKKMEDTEIEEVLKQLDILQYRDRKVMDLSGGERQRVSIAIAILRKAKVIIADEPCSSLDEENSRKVMEVFQKLSQEILIIFSSHNALMIEEYCDKVLDLEKDDFTVPVNPMEEGTEYSKSRNMLSLRKIWALQRSTVSGKKISQLFSLLFFGILIFIIAFSFSIHFYAPPVVTARDMLNRNIKGFSVLNTNIYEDLVKYGENIYELDNQPRILATEFRNYQAKEIPFDRNYAPIESVTKDDSLLLDEIRITDYTAYYLRYYDIIDFRELNDCINQELIINFASYSYSVKIVEVMETSFSQLYTSGKEIWNSQVNMNEGNFVRYCYANVWMNRETLYYLYGTATFGAPEKNQEYFFVSSVEGMEASMEPDKAPFVNCNWEEGTELTGNAISVNPGFLRDLKEVTGKDYQVGDTVTFTLKKSREAVRQSKEYTVVIKDIFYVFGGDYLEWEENSSHINVSSEMMDAIIKEGSVAYTGISGYYITNYGQEKELIKMLRFLKENEENRDDSGEETLRYFTYDGYLGICDIYDYLGAAQTMMIYVLVFVVCMTVFLVLYNTYHQYAANRTAFSILEIYGMGRFNEFIILYLGNLLLLLPAFVAGGVAAYFINQELDSLLKKKAAVDRIVSTYNFSYTIYSVLMVLGFTLIFVFLGYLLSLTKKLRSHIGNR